MKTFGFSFFILYACGTTEAERLRGMIAAVEIYDQREHNVPPSPDTLPVLPPTTDTHQFNPPLEISVHYEPPSYETQTHPQNNHHPTTAMGNNNDI